MIARLQTLSTLLLLVAVGLPGGLGVGMHALGTLAGPAANAEIQSGCSCCHHDCAPAKNRSVAQVHDCLICKFLVTAKQAEKVPSASAMEDRETVMVAGRFQLACGLNVVCSQDTDSLI